MSTITIYHNPACGTSRNTLALIRERGHAPQVIEYLKTPPSRDTMAQLVAATGGTVRDLLRTKEAAYTELNLGDVHKTDAQLLDAMVLHPVLMNRPIVITPLGTRLCRPAESVLGILPPVPD